MLNRMLLVSLLGIMLVLAPLRAEPSKWTYPQAHKDDIVDEYHGVMVADPYRWLEDGDTAQTREFVNAQNKLARSYVDGPVREQVRERLLSLWNYPRYSAPSRHGQWYFFTKNDGLQPQSILYMARTRDGEPKVLIDPNKLSEDGTVAISGSEYSHDGTLLAYGIAVAGSDQKEIRVRSTTDARDLGDVLKWCKFAGVAWKHDNSGFFYDRFPVPGSVPKQDEPYHNKLYWHTLGTPQDQDKLVYERPDEKEWNFSPNITEDGKYLYLTIYRGSSAWNRLYVREVESPDASRFIKLVDADLGRFSVVGNDGPVFYCYTTFDTPRGRLVAIDVNNPAPENYRTVLAQGDDPINWVRMINDQFVVCYLRDARHVLKLFNRDGSYVRDIELPTVGTVQVTGRREDREMFMTFTSMTYPSTILRYDFASGTTSVLRRSEVQFDPDQFETKQIFARSKDGTRVPIFVAHRKGLKLDGNNPTILNGYGGFNVGMSPNFSVPRVAWLEQGGVSALAVLRGGDEYGEEWHQDGMLQNKQNVFDDFTAAAEELCKAGYTNPKRLAIEGRSNGGLLVAACVMQRPQLFGAVLCHVPVTDMLRYHLFTVGRFWIPEYGNAQVDPAHFQFLYAYSPLHNVKSGVTYSPILVTTAEGDDRVVPAHARKFVATLQVNSSGANPILLLTQTRAGHGGGKPMQKQIDETADAYAFLAKVFQMEWQTFQDRTVESK